MTLSRERTLHASVPGPLSSLTKLNASPAFPEQTLGNKLAWGLLRDRRTVSCTQWQSGFLPVSLHDVNHLQLDACFFSRTYSQQVLQSADEGGRTDALLCVLSSAGRGSSELVIHRDVPEKVRHGLAVVDSSNCLRKNQADVHSLYLGTL